MAVRAFIAILYFVQNFFRFGEKRQFYPKG